jgi:hypothetical protein
MENILFENEICKELGLPAIPKKELDGKSPFDKGVGIVKTTLGDKAYAVVRFDTEKEQQPNVVKVFSSTPFIDIEKVFIVPSYMETDVEDADLDEESKKRVKEMSKEAKEIENEGVTETIEMPDNEYFFDHIHDDNEARAFIEAYNKRNKIKGVIPKIHDSLIMRLGVIWDETNKQN